MSYVSPPESRSRVENIKKKFETSNNDTSTPNSDNAESTKLPVDKPLASKVQPSNGFKSSVSTKRKTVHSGNSVPAHVPKKPTDSSPSVKTPNLNTPFKAERQVSNPCGKIHIRRSPAFRCDKMVKGRNVIGQNSGGRERTRSVVDNKIKLFEDGQSVKAVVKRLNASPFPSSLSTSAIDKPPKPQLKMPVAVEDENNVTNSGNSKPASHVNNVEGFFENTNGKTVVGNETDHEKSATNENYNSASSHVDYTPIVKVPALASVPSFLHRYEQDRTKLPLEIKRNVINRALEKSKAMKQNSVSSYAKVTKKEETSVSVNSVKSKNESAVPRTVKGEESCNTDTVLTDTIKAALKAPLPTGPPPKKPPRTFAHNVLSTKSSSPQNVPSATNSAMIAVSDKDVPCHLKFTKSASSDVVSIDKIGKPVRSKTESEIKLRKLESVLLNHQHGGGGIILRPKSPMVRRNVEDKATATYDEPELNHRKPSVRKGPLPNLPSESELLNSFKSITGSENSARFGGCINLNCVTTNSSNPMYSQAHFYEKVPEKQSEFFVTAPKKLSSPNIASKSYGTLLRSKSRSEEHIYAEPFEFVNKDEIKNNLQIRRNAGGRMKGGESVGDLSKVGKSLEELQKEPSPSSKPASAVPKTSVLHYLCTPINPEGTSGTNENETKSKPTELKNKDTITPIVERRAFEFQNLGSDSDEKKKPSLLRFAALVRGGQAIGAVDGSPNKVDRTKVQLLMNQAFGTPLQGFPISPIDLGSSDSESMASSPDDGGFVMVFPETTPAAVPQSNDNTKVGLTTAKCMEPPGDAAEDTSSTNSADQHEQMTRLSEERKVYVRRVSSRVYHRVRSSSTTPSAFPHLFQCILLVGLNLDSVDKKVKVPYIKTKYPLDADVPPHIEHLCFPDAKDWPPPILATPSVPGHGGIDEQSYSLVITNEIGERRFGYCRRVLPEGSNICLPLAYCIISPFRASGFYYKILAELESRHGQPEWLQTAFIKELYSCQFPAPGQGLRLSTASTTYNIAGPVCSMVTTVVRRPLDSRLEERDLTQLFSALPVPALLQLFGSLLLERKLILISNSLSRLSSCVEALQSILYPFSWQHTLIPVLPTSLLDICLSPTPYIVGILRGRDASTLPGPIEESLVVDLDESRILQGVGDEASILPTRLRRCLKVALQLVTSTTQPRDASRNVLISEAFVRMFVEVCGHYRNHVVTQQDGLKVFEKESFIKAVTSQSIRLFLEWFTETAMFSAFIESRLENESDVRGMFDQRCLEHSEEMENNTRLFLRNYKALNKKVKTFGDRLKDWTPFS